MSKLRFFANKIREKLREQSGETITETLVSMLIVVLSVTMLAGAIVAAARVNAGAEKHAVYLNQADATGIYTNTGKHIMIGPAGGQMDTGMTARTYKPKDASGIMYYYE